MRGAMVATIPYEGLTILSKTAQDAIMEKVERWEKQYNDSKPLPVVGPGVIPAGRPMGERRGCRRPDACGQPLRPAG